jgi:signal transduction histidine kinase
MVSSYDPNSEWLNTVAHDLKTPINSVRGCIELVKQLGPLNERQEHFATRALSGLQRMEHLVSRLLDISWADTETDLDLDWVSLPTAIEDAVNLLEEMASNRNGTVEIQLDPNIDMLFVDSRRIAQVLDNLISNAIKYNREGGHVAVTAAHQGDTILIGVRDNGMGISEEDQSRIFERFFRSKQGIAQKIEGSGLGLAITKAIVEKHGGRIWFESKLDEGTVFYFTIPLTEQISDGDDSSDESTQDLGESPEGYAGYQDGFAVEEPDSVDDNIQENLGKSHLDESSDAD